jgi:hypothetical protein
MPTLSGFLPEVQSLPLAEFLKRYDHPFLLISEPQKLDLMTGSEYHTTEHRADDCGTRRGPLPVHLVERQVYELKKGGSQGSFSFFSIGRSSNNDIVLAGTEISKLHAVIQHTGKGFSIMDSSSRNGTFLNGVKLQPQKLLPLADKDLVTFAGLFAARFLLPSSLYAWLKGDRGLGA